MNRNLWILIISQIFSFTPGPINVFLSGIVGTQLAVNKSFATIPTALLIVGTASFSFFAAKIMSIIGRKKGFLLSSFFTSFSSLIAAYSIHIGSFYLFCLSCFLIGNGMAFTHQYRFAAVENTEKEFIPKILSFLMLVSIFAALIGPNVANQTINLIPDSIYAGSYISLAGLTFVPFILLWFYQSDHKPAVKTEYVGRGYLELIFQPRFLQAMVSAALGYAIMSLLMTATPISMHVLHDFTLNDTKLVIQFHVIGMFLPSLFTGYFLKKFGHSKIIYTGIFIYFVVIVLSYLDQTFINYLISLILLGVGWNFLYLAGTGLLVLSYKEEEKFRAQGINDIIVFSIQALGSLSAGYILNTLSWKSLNMIVFPFLIIMLLVSIRADLSKK
ncbi:MAG: MFS transporter [Pelagibacteraceae bacterium]